MSGRPYAVDSELVIGLVAPVGIDLDSVKKDLENYFRQVRYTVNFLHLSKVAEAYECNHREENTPAEQIDDNDEKDRLDIAMTTGNALRDKVKRGDFYALLAIREIIKERDSDAPMPRTVHVLRSLKHKDEVATLRQAYGSGFFLLGVSASTASKKNYLGEQLGVPAEEIERLIARDENELDPLGQHTRDVFQMADAFIASDRDQFNDLSRTLDILFSKPTCSPTAAEYAMFMAYAAALRSADLSRQVGAVLTNPQEDIIATGANDVPKFGGGLYWPTDDDQRDHKLGYDTNEKKRDEIVLKVMESLISQVTDTESNGDESGLSVLDKLASKLPKGLADGADKTLEVGKNLLKDSGILDITEYGRAVHAEMEALLSAARNGTSVRHATLYTTTYPCHNCAKHIVAAGIEKVIYIEPYPKSYAEDHHGDSIDGDNDSATSGDKPTKVIFEAFVGIGPRRFIDLFSMSLSSGTKLKRKKNGRVAYWSRESAELRVPMIPLSYLEAEALLDQELERAINSLTSNDGENDE
tara:strand:- start:332 stop:1912 length:1581 start_codon:yes stop_codon:yes gene_type:complete